MLWRPGATPRPSSLPPVSPVTSDSRSRRSSMSLTTDRLPVSKVNTALVATFVIGAAITFALGQIIQGVGLLALSAGGLCCALWGRRTHASGVPRLNSLEWRDERDRRLGKDALSLVGAAALIVSIIELVITSIL